jgi:hypothetical protein
MRDEVAQDVPDIQRQIAPHIALRRRQDAAGGEAQLQQFLHPTAAALQRSAQLTTSHRITIDPFRRGHAVLASQRSNPAAARIVEVRRNHPDRAPRRAGDLGRPQRRWKTLDQFDGDPIARPPGRQQGSSEIKPSLVFFVCVTTHFFSQRSFAVFAVFSCYHATIEPSNSSASSSGPAGRGDSFVTRCCGSVPSTSDGISDDE